MLELIEAVKRKDIKRVEELIESGADVNVRDDKDYGMTLLHHAVLNIDIEMLKLLLAKGAKVNTADDLGNTPLCYAKTKLAKVLLENGAYTNIKNKFGYTSLHLAVRSNDVDKVKLLVAYGAEVNVNNRFRETPLHLVSHRIGKDINNTEIIQLLLVSGADVDVKDVRGQTPLSLASKYGNHEIIMCLTIADSDFLNKIIEFGLILNFIQMFKEIKNLISGNITALGNRFGETYNSIIVEKIKNMLIYKYLMGKYIEADSSTVLADPEYLKDLAKFRKDIVKLIKRIDGILSFKTHPLYGLVKNKIDKKREAFPELRNCSSELLIEKCMSLLASKGIFRQANYDGFQFDEFKEIAKYIEHETLQNPYFTWSYKDDKLVEIDMVDTNEKLEECINVIISEELDKINMKQAINRLKSVAKEQNDNLTPLCVSIITGDLTEAQRLLSDDINKEDMHTILGAYLEIGKNDVKVLNYLNNTGIDINLQCKNGQTPLDIALQKKNIEGVKWLLSEGTFIVDLSNIKSIVSDYDKIIIDKVNDLISNARKLGVSSQVIEKAEINLESSNNWFNFWWNKKEILNSLQQTNIELREEIGKIERNKKTFSTVVDLIKSGEIFTSTCNVNDWNMVDEKGDTFLHIAAKLQNRGLLKPGILDFLLTKVDPNIRNNAGMTAKDIIEKHIPTVKMTVAEVEQYRKDIKGEIEIIKNEGQGLADRELRGIAIIRLREKNTKAKGENEKSLHQEKEDQKRRIIEKLNRAGDIKETKTEETDLNFMN